MGRYSRLDTDEDRLPENMIRIGYDADTQVYTYRDQSDNSVWEGPPGSRYGTLHCVSRPASGDDNINNNNNNNNGSSSPPPPPYRDDNPYTHPPSPHAKPEAQSWRQENMPLLNFLLLIGLFLLALFWFMGFSLGGGGASSSPPTTVTCAEGQVSYSVRGGDTCWAIAETRGLGVQDLARLNPGVDCDKLGVGEVLCLPGKEK